jgi:hypothetical protein
LRHFDGGWLQIGALDLRLSRARQRRSPIPAITPGGLGARRERCVDSDPLWEPRQRGLQFGSVVQN